MLKGEKMKKIFLKNKAFVSLLIMLIISSLLYKGYKVIQNKNNKVDKEIVTLILKNDEIKKGIVDAVRNYNHNNDEVYINLVLTSDDYVNLVNTKLANKDEVDIFEYDGKTLLEKDFIQPLDNLNIDLSNVTNDSLFSYNDEVIGVKYGMAMPKIMYNKDILIEVGIDPNFTPKNLDELIYIAEKIKSKFPDITPLDVSLSYIHDLFSFLGTISSSENTTYPTLWNYKTARYDYSGLNKVLEKFNHMYEKGLINKDFDIKTSVDMYNDFKNEESAMMITNYYNKYSVMDRFKDMNLKFSDIPFETKEKGQLFYYTYPRILVIANNNDNMTEEEIKHNLVVKEVYEWLLSQEVTDYLVEKDSNFTSFGNNHLKNDVYDELNNNTNYKHLEKDPTEILVGNSEIIKDHIISMIKGEEGISKGIRDLEYEVNEFINNNSRNSDVNLDYYKEN